MMEKESRLIRDVEAGGSNPLAPTTQAPEIIDNSQTPVILNNDTKRRDESRTKHDSTGNAVQNPCSVPYWIRGSQASAKKRNEEKARREAAKVFVPPPPCVPVDELPDDEVTFVYILENRGFHKIGLAQDVAFRIKKLQTANPLPITLKFSQKIYLYTSRKVEIEAHRLLSELRACGEWFACDYGQAYAAVESAIKEKGKQGHYQKLYTPVSTRPVFLARGSHE